MGDVICIYHVQFYTVGFTIILVFRVGPAYCVRNGKVPFPFKEDTLSLRAPHQKAGAFSSGAVKCT